MPPEGTDAAEKCPVDHRTRQQWLEGASKANKSGQNAVVQPPNPSVNAAPATRWSLDSNSWQTLPLQQKVSPVLGQNSRLSTEREISSIPRAISDVATLNSAERAALPSNSEQDTGHDAASGNWVYPSPSQFFSAMQRKGHDANPADMSSVVPIHNAVNERVWAEVKKWEEGWGSERCGGPKLVSFQGDSKKLTPRARWNSLLGYREPFDRHDWIVDRCGTKVEYVIDFYKGRDALTPLSFYLDVRPKLNSFEGCKMRAFKAVGLA